MPITDRFQPEIKILSLQTEQVEFGIGGQCPPYIETLKFLYIYFIEQQILNLYGTFDRHIQHRSATPIALEMSEEVSAAVSAHSTLRCNNNCSSGAIYL